MTSWARRLRGLILIFLLLLPEAARVRACTIFVLVDGERALFFNNEDFSNPNTRLWFIPAGTNYFGCAYVGFDDGWAQGGVNTEGLAYDWVAGFMDKYEPSAQLLRPRGNSSQRMIETCRTVDEAIAFYRKHRETEVARARIMVADKTGASAIIGARDGEVFVDRQTRCRGFGYGREVVAKMLATPPEATVANGVKILRAALQKGEYGTKYSTVYDLRSGDLFVFNLQQDDEPARLNLSAELNKGAHCYDIPRIKSQLASQAQPLQTNMKRFYLDEFKPIGDPDPKLTARLTGIMRGAAAGRLNAEDYTPELWKILKPQQETIQADLAKLGEFQSLTLVNRLPNDLPTSRRYLATFARSKVLQTFEVNDKNQIANSSSEAVEPIP
jgi:hypothetical protein